jgi:RND family efflux transporter MFP subunit
MVPEVGGRIIWLNKNFIPGSRLKKGEIVAKIDNRDYKLAFEQQMGQVQQAELNLTLEKGRGEIAKEEWNMLGDGSLEENASILALRKPQMQEATQRTLSAKSGLKRARLNLKRTVIRAPFDAIVVDKNVDIGQLVGPATPVGTIMGSEELWVDVSVPVESLNVIRIPGLNAKEGSPAKIVQTAGSATIERTGSVIRLHGRLNSKNRTATVLVSVKNPFDMKNGLPLLAGAYVDVEIKGVQRQNLFKIPASALKDTDSVWLVKNNHLKKVRVKIAWKEKLNVILSGGVQDGDEIVTSPISFPLDGMLVKRLVKKSGE